jgi:hypothetical protein
MKLKQQTDTDIIFIYSADYELLMGRFIIKDISVWTNYIQIYTR